MIQSIMQRESFTVSDEADNSVKQNYATEYFYIERE